MLCLFVGYAGGVAAGVHRWPQLRCTRKTVGTVGWHSGCACMQLWQVAPSKRNVEHQESA